MEPVISQRSFRFPIYVILIFFSFLNVAFGKSMNVEAFRTPSSAHGINVNQDHQPYIEDVRQKLQKSRELLKDLKKMRTQASSEEEQQNLYVPVMKLTKELEHAERFSKNLDVIDPQPWLRNKTEMNAVLANLEVAYDEALPFLHDKTRSLQEAVHHAQVAAEYGKEGRKDLFLKNTLAAKKYASLAQKEGIDSGFVKEGISELEDALSHISQDNVGAAATLVQGAYLHLNSALKKSVNIE